MIVASTQALIDLLSTPWSYLVMVGVAALDAVVPVFPSETLAITGGVLAALGDLSLGLMIVSAAIGAFVGDSTAYALGRTLGTRARDRLLRGERAQRALRWAERQLDERGWYLVLVARFVPGGRTVTTLTAACCASGLRPSSPPTPSPRPPGPRMRCSSATSGAERSGTSRSSRCSSRSRSQ